METQIVLAGDITAGFKVFDVDGFEHSINSLVIVNAMDVPVLVSFDGLYSHEYIPAHETIDIVPQVCASIGNERCLFKNKSKVYVKRLADIPKGGAVVLMGFYQE